MGLDFLKYYSGCRLEALDLHKPLLDESLDPVPKDKSEEKVILDYETNIWQPITINLSPHWQPRDWPDCPVRFIDGKDVGQTIAWVRATSGQLVPIRLSQIGSISMNVENGECRREFHVVERVVSMEVDLFPWTEIESFAGALQAHGFRLLSRITTRTPDEVSTFDFDTMRKVAQNRTRIEMRALEEAAIAYNDQRPTLVDGPLEPCKGGFDQVKSPVIGVIKTPRKLHLSCQEKQLLYQLEVGERTPVFCLPEEKLPVVTWYLRLTASHKVMPSGGVVRVEVCQKWFERYHTQDWNFVNKVSRTLHKYRCREHSYDRTAISLHPIKRGEESLGSLFDPSSTLTHRFYRLTEL